MEIENVKPNSKPGRPFFDSLLSPSNH